MEPENSQNPPHQSSDLRDSPLRRRIQANAGFTTSGRNLPKYDPGKRRQAPDDAHRAIGHWSLIPIIIMIVVVWLWFLDVIPAPPYLFSLSMPGGAEPNNDFWALANGMFLALGAGYLFWLGRRLSSLGRYNTPTYPVDDGTYQRKPRKTWSGWMLRSMAVVMVIKVVLILVNWGSSD